MLLGNGPAGLTASFLLAGHQPVYNGARHPDPMLSARLCAVAKEVSIMSEESLQFLAQVILIFFLMYPSVFFCFFFYQEFT